MYVNKIKNHQLIRLEAEISALRSTEKDYNSIEMQLRNLENRYHILNEEKTLRDAEHHKRRERANRQILLRKKQLSELQAEKSRKLAELKAFCLESEKIRQEISQLDEEKQKLTASIYSSMEQQRYTTRQIQRLVKNQALVAKERQKTSLQSIECQQQIDKTNKINQKLQQQLEILQIQAKSLLKSAESITLQAIKYQNQLTSKNQQKQRVQKHIADSSQAIRQLAIDIEMAIQQQDQERRKVSTHYQMVESQRLKHSEIIKNISMLEQDKIQLQVKNKEIQSEIKRVIKAKDEIMEKNKKLIIDSQCCQRHLNTLSNQNQQIVQELLKLSEEDETIRTLIDRRSMARNAQLKLSYTPLTSLSE